MSSPIRKRTSVSTHAVKGHSEHRDKPSRNLTARVDGNGVVFSITNPGPKGGEMDVRISLGDGADLTAFLRAALHGAP